MNADPPETFSGGFGFLPINITNRINSLAHRRSHFMYRNQVTLLSEKVQASVGVSPPVGFGALE
jgi:hypothetical protein